MLVMVVGDVGVSRFGGFVLVGDRSGRAIPLARPPSLLPSLTRSLTHS